MGLLNKFNNDGSYYTVAYTPQQPNTPLATDLSNMHYYSVGRTQYLNEVNDGYMLYDDRTPNTLPQTTQLSINNGYTPSQYIYNLPQ